MSKEHSWSIQKYYEERAKDYDKQKRRTWRSQQGFPSTIIDTVLSFLSNIHEGPILEVGVGSARVSLPILNKVKSKLIGLDLSWEMLNLANKRLKIHPNKYCLTLGNGELLPIKSDILCGLICISVFHYLLSPENVLMEFSRCLKDEGVYIYGDLTLHEEDTSSFLDRLEKIISHAHVKYYTPSEMKSLIEESGIKVDQIDTFTYKKSYSAIIQDKAQYFDVSPSTFYEFLNYATETEKNLYGLKKEQMTLFFTIIKGTR